MKTKLPKGVYLAFCPTGEGGGIDNSCSPANAGIFSPELKRELGFPQEPTRPASPLPATDQRAVNLAEIARLEAEGAAFRARYNELRRLLRSDPDNAVLRAEFNDIVRRDRPIRNQIRILRAAIAPATPATPEEQVDAEITQVRQRTRATRRAARQLSRVQQRLNEAAASIPIDEFNYEDGRRLTPEMVYALRTGTSPLSSLTSEEATAYDYMNVSSYNPEHRRLAPESRFNKWLVQRDYNNGVHAAYLFKTPSGRTFKVSISGHMDDTADLIFTDDEGSTGRSGRGEAFHVFAGVVPAVTAFIDKYKPKSLHYTAAQESRFDLYDKLTETVMSMRPGSYSIRKTRDRSEASALEVPVYNSSGERVGTRRSRGGGAITIKRKASVELSHTKLPKGVILLNG